MTKSLSTLGMASLLLMGVAGTSFAAGAGAQPSQSVTGTETSSQQLSAPATGAQVPAGSYSMSTPGGTNNNAGPGSASAPTPSSPDAANPAVQSPSGGGSGK
jgi:hypothetical protein